MSIFFLLLAAVWATFQLVANQAMLLGFLLNKEPQLLYKTPPMQVKHPVCARSGKYLVNFQDFPLNVAIWSPFASDWSRA